jgi:hypothetical protein
MSAAEGASGGGGRVRKKGRRLSKRSHASEFLLGLLGCGRTVSPPSSPELVPTERRELEKIRGARNGSVPRDVTMLGPPPTSLQIHPPMTHYGLPRLKAGRQPLDVAALHTNPKEYHSLPLDRQQRAKRRKSRRTEQNSSSSSEADVRAAAEERLLREASVTSSDRPTSAVSRPWLDTTSDLLPATHVGGRRRQREKENEKRKIFEYANESKAGMAASAGSRRVSKIKRPGSLYLQPFFLARALHTQETLLLTNGMIHGPLKLRTVHFGDITIIYESKVSEQNIFPWLKGTIESRPHTKFQINCLFK